MAAAWLFWAQLLAQWRIFCGRSLLNLVNVHLREGFGSSNECRALGKHFGTHFVDINLYPRSVHPGEVFLAFYFERNMKSYKNTRFFANRVRVFFWFCVEKLLIESPNMGKNWKDKIQKKLSENNQTGFYKLHNAFEKKYREKNLSISWKFVQCISHNYHIISGNQYHIQ